MSPVDETSARAGAPTAPRARAPQALARAAHADAASATPPSAPRDFDEVATRLHRGAGARRGRALPAVQERHVHRGLPGQHRHQELHRPHHRRRLRRPAWTCSRSATRCPPSAGACARRRSSARSRCVLAKKGEPVAIGRLERFLGDFDLACEIDHRCMPEVAPPSGKRCAVVGSGPAGLACAGELARLRPRGDRLRVAPRARAACSPTASPSSGCPRRSSRPRSRCSARWA